MNKFIPSQEDIERSELVLDIFQKSEENGVLTTLLGGFGLDALYGKLTRSHEDVDFGIHKSDEENFVRIISERGFKLKEKQENPKEYKVEYHKGNLILEYSTDDRLKYFSGIEYEDLFPNECNGILLGKKIRTPTLKGHKWMIEVQNERAKLKGWGKYKHLRIQKEIIKELEIRDEAIE